MNQKGKYIKVVAALLLTTIGILGCSAKDSKQSQDNVQETKQAKDEQQERTQAGISDEENITKTANSAEKGFETPEAAVTAYLAGLKDNDFDRMADTFGEGSGTENISRQYAILCGIDLIPEVSLGNSMVLNESEDVEKFLGQLTQLMKEADFSSLEFMGFVPQEKLTETYSSDTYQKNLLIIAQNNGGSELENLVAAIKVNGNQYMLFFDTIKRDGRWYNFQLGGILANMLDHGIVEAAGTVRMDTHDEKILKQLLKNSTESLPEFDTAAYGAAQPIVEGEGFDTPQQAAAGYLEGLKANDINQMISTFSVESYAEHYNLQAYLEFTKLYSMQQDVALPPVNGFAKDLISYGRKEQLKEDVLKQGNALYQWSNFLNDSQSEFEDVPLEWEKLQEKVDLDSIQVLGYLLPETLSESYSQDAILSILKRQLEIYGADQIENCVIVFEYGGDKYCLFTEAVEYEGKWYNSQLGNQIEMLFGISSEFMGTEPLEVIIDPATAEELMIPIE